MKIWMLILPLMFFASEAAAEQACTEIGCTTGLSIEVEEGLLTQRGAYIVEMALGREKVTCTGELPLKPCENGATFRCDSPDVSIVESGCAMPPEQQGISNIVIDTMPRRVVVGVRHNGQQILVRNFKPVYRFVRPNGPTCEPECVVSTVKLSGKPPAP